MKADQPQPLVSVIMVFHVTHEFLQKAVCSVFEQTLREWELILVDNGTGMPLSALGEIGADDRIRIVRMPENVGNAAGVNAGIEAARGEFIAILDSDDIALPRRLELQVAALRANPQVGFMGAAMDDIDEAGNVLGRRFVLLRPEEHRVFLRYAPPVTISSVTGRRELFATVRFRTDFAIAPDYDFFLRANERAESCALPEVLGQYRIHHTQMTQSNYVYQVMHGCIARICAAQRRIGREANIDTMAELIHATPDAWTLAMVYAHFAQLSLDEGLGDMVAYHTRKLLSVDRSPASLRLAAKIMFNVLRRHPRDRVFLLRLFFTGPLKAHGLKPAK